MMLGHEILDPDIGKRVLICHTLHRDCRRDQQDSLAGCVSLFVIPIAILWTIFSIVEQPGAMGLTLIMWPIIIAGYVWWFSARRKDAANVERLNDLWQTLYYCRNDDVVLSSRQPTRTAEPRAWRSLLMTTAQPPAAMQ